jgi:hypothetical protein
VPRAATADAMRRRRTVASLDPDERANDAVPVAGHVNATFALDVAVGDGDGEGDALADELGEGDGDGLGVAITST